MPSCTFTNWAVISRLLWTNARKKVLPHLSLRSYLHTSIHQLFTSWCFSKTKLCWSQGRHFKVEKLPKSFFFLWWRDTLISKYTCLILISLRTNHQFYEHCWQSILGILLFNKRKDWTRATFSVKWTNFTAWEKKRQTNSLNKELRKKTFFH